MYISNTFEYKRPSSITHHNVRKFMSVRVIFKKSPIFTAKKIAPVPFFEFILVWALSSAKKSILDLVPSSIMHLQLGYLIVHCKKYIFIVVWLCERKANFWQCKNFFLQHFLYYHFKRQLVESFSKWKFLSITYCQVLFSIYSASSWS